METLLRLGFLGVLVAFLGICYQGMQRLTTYEPNQPVYSAPHVVPQYADTDQDGFVPAQGDPLYDQHYAQQVNLPNSEAVQGIANVQQIIADANYTQAQAEQIQVQTELMEQDAKMGIWGARVTAVIVIAVLLLIAAMIFR